MSAVQSVKAAYLADIPVRTPPFRDSPSTAEALLVAVITDDGHVGYSIVDPYQLPFGPNPVLDFIESRLQPVLAGLDPQAKESNWATMSDEFMSRGTNALAPILRSVDTALWELAGKISNLPMWKMFGGSSNQVPVYISCGTGGPRTGRSYLPGARSPRRYTTEELAQETAFMVEQGNVRVKIMVGRGEIPDPDSDYERVAAVREAIGDSAWLALDGGANMTLHDAVRLARRCEDLDVRFFEEPIVRNDARLLAGLRSMTAIPIGAAPIGDRSVYAELVRQGAVDFLQPNIIGIGATEATAVTSLATAHGFGIAGGNGFGPHNAALQAGSPAGWIAEYNYLGWSLYDALFDGVVPPDGGVLHLSDRPGFGLEPKTFARQALGL